MPATDLTPGILADINPYARLVIACGALLILISLLAVVAQIFRSRLSNKAPTTTVPQGFTLNDLRQMHANGQLSKEELDQAIARVSDKTRRRAMEASKSDRKPSTISTKM